MGKNERLAIYLGVDPGSAGGIGVLESDGTALGVPFPATLCDLWEWLSARRPQSGISVYAVIEKNTGYTGGPKGKGNPGSTMFKFGCNTGAYLMGLTAAEIPYEEVVPGVWQRGLGISPRKLGESKVDWKNRLKAVAQSQFPRTRITLATADALLIALYCRRKHEGTLRR